MKNACTKLAIVGLTAVSASVGLAEFMDRPAGIKIGERMTLRPYVGFSASFDSNVDGQKKGREDVMWAVNPGLNVSYKADSWDIAGGVYYRFAGYSKGGGSNNNDNHTFGENLTIRWANANAGERGWGFSLSENYSQVNESEDMMDSLGHDYSRDRRQFTGSAALQRDFGKGIHADVNASFYWLDFDNKNKSSYGLYGWNRWSAGAEIGYAASPWTDFLISGSYQGYLQENRKNSYYSGHPEYRRSAESSGYTVMGGIGTRATERIAYRVMGGWSHYDYKSGGSASDGFTYSVAGNWDISETWKTTLMAGSAYQPSEREFSSSQRVDSIAWGITHSMIRGRLSGSFDVAYRRQTREHRAVSRYDYDIDYLTFRLGLNYTVNRYLSLFSTFEYLRSFSDRKSSTGSNYDYDRFRGTLGFRLTY